MLKYYSLFIGLLLQLSLFSQVWEGQLIHYPNPSQGWRMRPVGDSVVWNYSHGLLTDLSFSGKEYSIQKTTNAGASWSTHSFPNPNEGFMSDILGINDKIAWASYVEYVNLDNVSHLYKTVDGGNTWNEKSIAVSYWLNWVYFYDDFNGIAMGDPDDDFKFEIFKTSDGGDHWTKLPNDKFPEALDQEYGNAGDFAVNNNFIAFSTTYGRVMYSSDKGTNWELSDFVLSPDVSTWGVVTDSKNNLYLAANFIDHTEHQLFRKSFNGDPVDITPSNNTEDLIGLCSIPNSDILLANYTSDFDNDSAFVTKISLDHGDTWKEISRGNRAGYVNFSNNHTGFACQLPTSYEIPSIYAFKYRGPIITAIQDQLINKIPIDISPNPVSHFIKLQWSNSIQDEIQLDLVSLDGKLIRTEKIKGLNSIERDIEQLPNGEFAIIISSKTKVLGIKEFIKN